MRRRTISFLLILTLMLGALPLMARATAGVVGGDVDGDGLVTAVDARMALRFSAKLDAPTPQQLERARLSGQTAVIAADARHILRISAELEDYDAILDGVCQRLIDQMTDEQKAAQLMMPAFCNWNGTAVTSLNDTLRTHLEKYGYAGLCLFAENTKTTEQTLALTSALQKTAETGAHPGLLLSVDQEGGAVTRLGSGTKLCGNMALGAIGDPDAARQAGAVIGGELYALGLNMDFAPVLDVNNDPANPVIGLRSISDDPATVAAVGSAMMTGIRAEGVAATLKHFPGHGDTATDSHSGLPVVDKSLDEIRACELAPFAEAVRNGADAIMTAHICFPQIEQNTYISKKDGKKITLPATLSKTILTDILRGEMGFDGVIVTDSLGMAAVSQHFDRMETAVMAINAGVDILLNPVAVSKENDLKTLEQYTKALAGLITDGSIDPDRLNDALTRILRLKAKKGLLGGFETTVTDARRENALAVVGGEQNRETEWSLAKRVVTLVRNENETLPLDGSGKAKILIAGYTDSLAAIQNAVLQARADGLIGTGVSYADLVKESISQLQSKCVGKTAVIAFSEQTMTGGLADANLKKIDALGAKAKAVGARFIAVSCCLPYDVARYTTADATLACFDHRRIVNKTVEPGQGMRAAVYAVFGAFAPTGVLPVDVPVLDKSFAFTDKTLYERGFGLTYGE